MRKKLLERQDWLGLSVCRPPDIHFTSAGKMTKIGRHRKLSRIKGREAAIPQRNSSNEPATDVLGGRKRDFDPSQSVQSPAQRSEPTLFFAKSSSWSSKTPVSSPPKQIHRSDSTKASGTSTSLSLPPLPLYDQERSTYRLMDDRQNLENCAEDLLPLEIARRMESFDSVQERYLSSRSGRGRGSGLCTSRSPLQVDELKSAPQLDSLKELQSLEPETLAQCPSQHSRRGEWCARSRQQPEHENTASLQVGRQQGKYQLNSDFEHIDYMNVNLQEEGRAFTAGTALASSTKISTFFPESEVNEVDTRDFALDVPDPSPSTGRAAILSANGTSSSQFFSDTRHSAEPSALDEPNRHQIEHSPEAWSQYPRLTAPNPNKRFKLDKSFDLPTQRGLTIAQASPRGDFLLSRHESPSKPTAYTSSVTPRKFTIPPLWQPSSANDDSNDCVGSGYAALLERSGKRTFTTAFSSSPNRSERSIFMHQRPDRAPLELLKHSTRPKGKSYSNDNHVTHLGREPRKAASRGQPESSIFSTPQKQMAAFDVHSTQSPFPLSYSGGVR